MIKQFITSILLVALSLVTMNSFAKKINLYAEPKANSKVTGTVDSAKGVTIVYTPKAGEWIKVANPENGDVGWIKSSDLGGNPYNMRVITNGDGTHHYSIYQFGGYNSKMNQEKIDKEMQQFQKQQRMIQIHMNHLFNDMFYFSQPLFVPVMMLAPEHRHR